MSQKTVAQSSRPVLSETHEVQVHQTTALVYLLLLAVFLMAGALMLEHDPITALLLMVLACWFGKAFGTRLDRLNEAGGEL